MTTTEGEDARFAQLLIDRRMQCRAEWQSYSGWLSVLTPLRWVMVGGAAVLSTFAGATALGRNELVGPMWHVYAALAAFGATLLTLLHSSFQCDAYQAECQRLIQLYRSLEMGYQAIACLASGDQRPRFLETDSKFRDAQAAAGTIPPAIIRRRAERRLGIEGMLASERMLMRQIGESAA
jgi:hypothetical protein